MEDKHKEVVEMRESLLEMYKAGFLDGYSIFSKPKTKSNFETLNKHYRKSFMNRFEKKITKELKKAESQK